MKSSRALSRYRKRPVIIDAVLIADLAHDDQPAWAADAWCNVGLQAAVAGEWWSWSFKDGGIDIHTREGTMHGADTDYLIKGVAGELYPCKPDIFLATYEAVE
jgi:hypothetical protein